MPETGFDGMPYRMTKIEDGAQAGFSLILGHHIRLHAATAMNQFTHYLRITLERDAAYQIPGIDIYDELQLSAEDAEKLRAWQPRDLGEAKRIPGISMSGLVQLMQFLRKDKARD